MGGDLNVFQGTELFYKMIWVRGSGACVGTLGRGKFHIMLLNASYHKTGGNIWLRGGDLNGLRDIKPFYGVLLVAH